MKSHIKKIKELSFDVIAGIDDATKCPCIGSIFISGVIANPTILRSWKKLGVKDSKLVSPKKRAQLETIIKETALGFAVSEITPAMIDNKTYNLNDWEMLVVLHIIQTLQTHPTMHTIIIDNWEVSIDRFKKRFNALITQATVDPYFSHSITIHPSQLAHLSLVPEHYADEHYTIVGAASILSKQASDKQYAKYRQEFGDFGSGNPGDYKTRLFVWQHRHNPPHIIRKSWKTCTMLASLEQIEDDPLYCRALNKHTTKKSSD